MTQTTEYPRFKSRLTTTLTTALLALGAFQIGAALPAVVQVQAAMSSAPSSLSLNVTDYAILEGQIMVALYTNAEHFNEEAAPFRYAKIRVTGPQTSVVFTDLPVGEYAFKIFHDENGNNELDTDMFGIPSEPYFFSTDASDPFSAPEFEESKFILPSGKMTRNVSLN